MPVFDTITSFFDMDINYAYVLSCLATPNFKALAISLAAGDQGGHKVAIEWVGPRERIL